MSIEQSVQAEGQTEAVLPLVDLAKAALEFLVDPARLAWNDRALCAQTDPDAFFPEAGAQNRDAKRVCMECEVRAECLDYAMTHSEEYGIWGGLSERERRRLRKQAQQ